MATAAEMIARYRAQNGTQKEGAAQASSGTTAADMIARYRAQHPAQDTTPAQPAQTTPTQTTRRVQPIFTPGEQAFSAAGAKAALDTAKAAQTQREKMTQATPVQSGFSAAQTKQTLGAARDYAMTNPNDATKKTITDRMAAIDREIEAMQPQSAQEAAVRRAGQIHALGAGDGASKEQAAEDALIKEKQSLQKILDGEYGKQDADWLKVLYSMALRGSDQFVSGVADTADMLVGGATKLLLGLTDAEYESLNTPTTAFKNWARKNAEINDAYFARAAGDSRAAQVAGELGAGVIGAVPQAVLALMSAGTSMAGQLGAAAGGLGATVSQAVAAMAKSPQYWLSFLQVAGTGYEDAKADGANELAAMSYGLINGTLNAIVEVGGGGIDALPDNLQQGGRPLLKWVESSLDEGKEEVVQGIIERGFQNLIYGKGNPLVSLTDEDAVINPITSAKEFGGGVVVGGILGAGQAGVSTAINRAARSGDVKQLGAAIREAGAADALMQEAKARGGEAAAMAQRIEGKRGKSAATDAELGELYMQTLSQTQSAGGHGREGSIPENTPETAAVTENAPTITENGPTTAKTAPRTAENPRVGTDGTRYAPRAGEETVLVPLPKAGETQGSKADANEIVSKLRQSLPELRNEPAAASLSGNEFAKGTKKLTEQVGDFFRSLGNSIFRKGFGSVIIDERGVKSDIAHGVGRAKAVTFAAVPAVIENGRQIDYQENWKGRGYNTYVFAAPVRIGNADSYVAVVVRSGADNRFYLHEVIDGDGSLIYKMDASPAIKTGVTAESGITGTGKAPTDGSSVEPTIPQTPTGVKSRFTPEGRIYAPRAGEGPLVLPTAEEEMRFRLSRNEGGNNDGQQRTEQNYSEQRGTEWDYSQQRADALSRGSEGWGGGERAGGENGVLAESRPRRAADAGRKTLERQAAGRALRLEKISSAELGLENGTNARSISVLPESAYDEELRTVSERIKRQTGLDATFVLGSIQIRTAEGTARVRGIYSRSGIIIQADHTRLSPGQIADHEIFHSVSENDPGLTADVERAITEKYGEEELGRMIDAYIQRLRGVIDIPENASEADIEEAVRAIKEELFADAYAGINSFGQHAEKYSGEARQTMRDRWMIEPGSETEAATARRTGPPERFSIEETGDGKKYVRADRQVIYGNDPRAWSEQLEDYINGKIRRGQDVTLIGADGDELRLTATTAGKLSDNHTSDGHTMSSEAFERKANAAAHIDELAQTSVRKGKTKPDKDGRHGDMASGGWGYRTAYFEDFDGKYYEITISTAQNDDGKMLYNIGQTKEEAHPKIKGSRTNYGDGPRGFASPDQKISQPELPVKRKFSLDEPVERTDTLLALHNMTEEKLRRTLKLGAWPSPSIAIVEAEQGHEKYGEYSAVFPASVIDPQTDSRNRVYGSDAWTPTDANARVEYEVDYDAKRSIERNIEQLSKKVANGMFSRSSVLGSAGIEDVTDADAKSIAKKLANQDAVKAAYLASRGEDVDIAYKAKEFDSRFGNDALRKYIDKVGPQRLAELYVKLETGERLTPYETLTAENVIRRAYEEKHAGLLNRKPEKKAERIARYMENNVTLSRVEDFIRHAQEYYADSGAVTDEIDRMATSDRLNAAVRTADVEAWVEGQLGSLLGEPGIYNGEDYYRPNGDRRSFAETHWDYNVENIVRAMNSASSRGEGMWNVTGPTLAATATPEYGSIEDMHADEGRLRRLDQGEYDRLMEDLGSEFDRVTDELMRTTKHHADNTYDEQQILGGIIAEAAQGKRTPVAIKQAFRREGYAISDGSAQSIIRLLEHAAQVPTEYFEAKPQRAVSFDEAVAVVAPDNAPAELIEGMRRAGMNVVEYAAGDEKSRLDTINRLENVRFSIDEITDEAGKAYGRGVHLDSTLLENLTASERMQMVKERVKELGGQHFTAYDSDGAEVDVKIAEPGERFINRSGKRVPVNRDLTTKNRNSRIKQESVVLADELITTARHGKDTPARYPHGWLDNNGKNDWAEWKTYIQDKENTVWEATLHIATAADGEKILYDIDPIKKAGQRGNSRTSLLSAGPPENSGTSTAGFNVSQPDENVNSRFSVDEGAEEKKKKRREAKPVAESRAIIAKRELRQNLIGTFSIPAGMKAEMGAYIDGMADRLIKNGALSQSDMSELFDRMYSSGVMELAADEMHQAARSDIAGRRIYVPERVKHEFGDDWADFRRSAFSAGVWLTNSPGDNGIGTMNAELAAELPGIFDAGETNERIMLERIVQAAEEGKAEKLSLAEYTALLAGREYVSEDDILDNMERQMDWALRTFAEKARLELKLRDRTGVKIAQEREKSAEMLKRERLRETERRAKETARRRDMAQRQRENRELREMQQKTLKQLRWLSQNRLKAPEELRAAFDDVLGDIDILAVGAANAMQWSNKYGATWGDLAQMYKDAQKNDPNFFPSKDLQNIVDRLDKAKIGDMDIDALTDLYKAAVGLRTEYYNRNNVLGSETHELFSEVYSDSRSELHFGADSKAGKAARSGKKLGKFFDEQLSPMNIMQRMTGWNKNSTFYGMAKQLEKGERDMRAYTVKATRMLQDFLTENADWARRADGQGKDGIWYEIEVPELLELGMGDKPIFGDTVKVYMTPTQKVHMYLESKGYDNLRHMAGGRTFADRALYSEGKRREAFAQGRTVKLAPETVKQLVSDLTPEEMGLARALESYYNSFAKDEINRVSNILYGFDKAIGQSYAPIYTNSNYNKTELGKFDTTAEGVGNLKARQYSKNPSYNIGAFDAFERHIDQTARFVGMAIPARNWETLLNWREGSSSMSDTISHEWGDAGLGYIKDLVTVLQSGRTSKGESVSTLADTILSNYIGAVFGANPSIVMKQLGSIPLASVWLGMENFPSPAQVKGIDRGLIAKYTQELDWRTMGYSMPETKTLKENPNWTQRNKFTRFTFGGGAITAMDGWAASVLWPWAENKVRREHPELSVGTRESVDAGESEFYKLTAEEFNEAVARSQSTSDEMHQGALRKSQNPLARALTMFKSDSSQTYNALRQMAGEAAYYKRVGDRDELRRANRRLGSAIIAAIGGYAWAEAVEFLMNLWKRGGKKYRDDEGELTAESVAKQMVLGLVGDLAGIVTGGEELADAIGAAVTGGKWYELQTPGLEQLNDITNLIVGAIEGSFDVFSDAADIVRNGGDLAEYLHRHGGDIAGGIKELAAAAATYIPGISVNNLEAYLLGTVRTVSPELAAAYEDMFQTAVKSRLDGLTGDALAERIGGVLSVRRVEAGEETAEQLAALYEAGYREAVPADTPKTMSVNGEERKLSPYQQQTYDTVWSSTIGSALDELVGSSEFEQAGDEERAGMVKALYDYAADAAKKVLFDDYESKGGADIEPSRWAAWKGAESALAPENGKADVSDAQRYALLQSMDYTDEEKAAIAGSIMGTEMTTPSGKPSAYAKMLEALDTGLGMDDYLELRIAGAVDRYLDAAAAGANVQTAKDAALALAALEPEEGKTQVSDAQRWRAALDAAQTGEEEMNALKAVMDERQFAKLGIARDYGIDTELFVSLKEVLPQFDENGNGSINSDELEAAIDAMGGGLLPAVGRLTQAQQAALWQIYTASTDPTNNPFGVGVGRKVQKAKEAAMEEIKAREKGK